MSRLQRLLAPLARLAESAVELPLRGYLRRRLLLAPPAAAHGEPEMLAHTDALNAAAEHYFATYEHPEFLLAKPFSDFVHLPQYLFNLGTLFHCLRLAPGDVVLELGAGSCWVSHFLNRAGCRTLSVDPSPTALELGRRLFEADPHTRWDLDPLFLPYDGHRLPAADGSCDRIVLHDAFHHIPNVDDILREMARVLVDDGLVAMSEPGRHHSASPSSRHEAESTGVLENDVVIEELAIAAQRAGFSRTAVVPLSLAGSREVPAEDFLAFVTGKGLAAHWLHQARDLLAHHYIVLYKGEPQLTTRHPGLLRAEIDLGAAAGGLTVAAGEAASLRLRLTNRGDTLWLADTGDRPGSARLGARLMRPGASGEPEDWHRELLPGDVAPGGSVVMAVTLPALAEPGDYRVILDLVAEQVAWFEDHGSTPAVLRLIVG